MYRLCNQLHPNYMRREVSVVIAGCGGTGGFVAEGLCRLLPDFIGLLLVDHDKIEEQNLVRQNFYRSELGQFKSQALAYRLSQKFQRRVAYLTTPIYMLPRENMPFLLVGCVDNGMARRDIAELVRTNWGPTNVNALDGWWVDAGNGRDFGQILIGNHSVKNLQKCFETEKEICVALPLPTEQRPELLVELPQAPACAEALALDEQSQVINQCIASLVTDVVYKILLGTCPWMQLNLDMATGTLSPVLATPENVAHMTGLNIKNLTFVENKQGRR